jgi:hypothetical protein
MKWTLLTLSLVWASAIATDNSPQVIPTMRPADMGLNWVDLLAAGSFTAKGTWTTTDLSDDDNLVGYPINLAEIQCRRDWHECLMTQTSITDNDWFTLRSEGYRITRWTSKEIVATLERLCVTAELTINVAKKQAFIVEREGGYTTDNCVNERKNNFAFSLPLTKPRVLVLQAPEVAIANDPRVKRKGK